MIVSIHQPDYIPYIGYFYKIAMADVFVFLDDVQFSNENMHHWNKIKTPQGECRLKIPVDYSFRDAICQVRTKDELGWKEMHLKTLEMNYARARFFHQIYPDFRQLLLAPYAGLSEMNMQINQYICKGFGIERKFIKSSDLGIQTTKEERVLDICRSVGGNSYLSGNGARVYQKEEHFTLRGLKLCYTDYYPIKYNQLWNEFIPNLSVLDYLFNYGFDFEYIQKAVESHQSSE